MDQAGVTAQLSGYDGDLGSPVMEKVAPSPPWPTLRAAGQGRVLWAGRCTGATLTLLLTYRGI